MATRIDEALPWDFGSWTLAPFVDGAPLTFNDPVPDKILLSLAGLHADFRDRLDELSWTWTFDGARMRNFLAQAIEGTRMGRDADSDRLAKQLIPLSQLSQLEALADTLPRTLCHGDIHPGNMIVDSSGHSWLIDWGNVCVAPPTLDVANLVPYGSPTWVKYEHALRESGWNLDGRKLELAHHWAKVATGLQYLPWIAANTDFAAGMIGEVLKAADRLESLA